MTKTELYQVGRSWIGHLATNPEVRSSLDKLAGDKEKIAGLINETVQPPVRVTTDNVNDIKGLMDKAFGPRAALIPDEDGGAGELNRFYTPPPDELKPEGQ